MKTEIEPLPPIAERREIAAILGRAGGRKGGKSKSLAKQKAAQENGKLGGKPKAQ